MSQKKPYAKPRLIVHGRVEAITQASSIQPSQLDQDFPAGTYWYNLTWASGR